MTPRMKTKETISTTTKKKPPLNRSSHKWRGFLGVSELEVVWSRCVDELRSQWIRIQLNKPYPPPHVQESVGAYGERLAAIFLQRKGHFVLEKSFRVFTGEVDIVSVWRKRVIVFTEVKTWLKNFDSVGGPSDRVDEAKQRKITQTALRYMKQHRLLGSPGRFDVIEVILEPDKDLCSTMEKINKSPNGPSFRHFECAFEASGLFQMFS